MPAIFEQVNNISSIYNLDDFNWSAYTHRYLRTLRELTLKILMALAYLILEFDWKIISLHFGSASGVGRPDSMMEACPARRPTTCFVNRPSAAVRIGTIKLPGTPTRDQLARARPHGSTGANTSPRQVKSIQDDTVHTVPARQNDTRTDHNRHRCLAPIAHGGAARRIPLTTRAPWRAHGRPGVGRRVNTYT